MASSAKSPPPKTVSPPVRNLDSFRATYDVDVVVPNKIREALEELKKLGPEWYWTDQELISHARISTVQLSTYRPQFVEHQVKTPRTNKTESKVLWFADPAIAELARNPSLIDAHRKSSK